MHDNVCDEGNVIKVPRYRTNQRASVLRARPNCRDSKNSEKNITKTRSMLAKHRKNSR